MLFPGSQVTTCLFHDTFGKNKTAKHVSFEIAFNGKLFETFVAFIRFLSRVGSHMPR